MKLKTYLLPSHWASALINDDWTGLDDEDVDAVLTWLTANQPGYCVDCDEESQFCRHHDASGLGVLAADCLTFTFQEV